MDQHDHFNTSTELPPNVFLDMMKQHISGGLPFQYTNPCRSLTTRARRMDPFVSLSSSQLKIPIHLFNRRAMATHRPSLNMNWTTMIRCQRPLSTRSEHESNSHKSRYDDATRWNRSSHLQLHSWTYSRRHSNSIDIQVSIRSMILSNNSIYRPRK